MATKNEALVSETAAALLSAIKEAAPVAGSPSQLKDLAEALALVAGADPRKAPAVRAGAIG